MPGFLPGCCVVGCPGCGVAPAGIYVGGLVVEGHHELIEDGVDYFAFFYESGFFGFFEDFCGEVVVKLVDGGVVIEVEVFAAVVFVEVHAAADADGGYVGAHEDEFGVGVGGADVFFAECVFDGDGVFGLSGGIGAVEDEETGADVAGLSHGVECEGVA